MLTKTEMCYMSSLRPLKTEMLRNTVNSNMTAQARFILITEKGEKLNAPEG